MANKKQKNRDYKISIEELRNLEQYNYRKHDESHLDWLEKSIMLNGLNELMRVAVIGKKELLYIGNGRAEAIKRIFNNNPDKVLEIRVRYDYFNSKQEMINRAVKSNQGAKESVFELSKLMNENEDFDTSNITVPSYYKSRKERISYIKALKSLIRFPALEKHLDKFQTDNRKGKGLSWVYLLQSSDVIINLVIERIEENDFKYITCTEIDNCIKSIGITLDNTSVIDVEASYESIQTCITCQKATVINDTFGQTVQCYDKACAKIKFSLELAGLKAESETNLLLPFDKEAIERDFDKDFVKEQFKGFKVIKNAQVLDNKACTFAKKALSLEDKAVVDVCFDECCPIHSNNVNEINAEKDDAQLSKKTERLKKKWDKHLNKKIQAQSIKIIKEEFDLAFDQNDDFLSTCVSDLVVKLLKHPGAASDKRKFAIAHPDKVDDNFVKELYLEVLIDTTNHELFLQKKNPTLLEQLKSEVVNTLKVEIQDAKDKIVKRQTKVSTKFLEMKKYLIDTFKELDEKALVQKVNDDHKEICKALSLNHKDYKDIADRPLLVHLINKRLIEFGLKTKE
ncbi:MAG: hypothetical protein AB8G11_11155 [Saprospiraceae bacterium]